MKKNNKTVTKKNYYVVLVVSVLTIILTLYIRTFYLNYESNKLNNSVFNDKSIKQINMEDIDYAVKETNEAIIYVSYTGSKEIYNMEKRLFKEVNNKKITDKFIYLDITDSLKDKEYVKLLREHFTSIQFEINDAPILIYVKDGEAKEAMSSELKTIDYTVLNDLLDKYEIE